MGSENNRASDQARRDEQERMAAIQRTQGAINRVFDDPRRAAEILDVVNARRDYLTRDLDEQKAANDRELRFALARSGQIGGSSQIDQQSRFARDYSRGLLDIDQRARQTGAQLEAGDQDARARLISLATSGLDATTAAQQSAAAMRTSLEAGRSEALTQGLGDVFGRFTKFYQDSRDAAVRRRADQQAFGLYGSTGSGFGYGGN